MFRNIEYYFTPRAFHAQVSNSRSHLSPLRDSSYSSKIYLELVNKSIVSVSNTSIIAYLWKNEHYGPIQNNFRFSHTCRCSCIKCPDYAFNSRKNGGEKSKRLTPVFLASWTAQICSLPECSVGKGFNAEWQIKFDFWSKYYQIQPLGLYKPGCSLNSARYCCNSRMCFL